MKNIQFIICILFSSGLFSQGVYNNGGKIVVGTGVTLYINGNYQNETNGSDGSIDLSGTLKLGGNFTNNVADAGAIGNAASASKVELIGTTAQTIGGTTSSTFIFPDLTVNNSSGVTLTKNTGVTGALTLTSGLVDIGSSNLTFGPDASVAGTPSASGMIVATGGGEVRKEYTGAGSFAFPVGDNTGTAEYSPVSLSFTAGTFNPGAYAGVNLVNAAYTDPYISGSYLNRYWNVSQTGITGFTCDAAFNYQIADVVGTESDIYCARINPAPVSLFDPANIALHQLTATGLTSFGTFTGAPFPTLPNIALNKPATAQSALSSATLAGKAVDADGTNNSYWGASPSPQWLKVDLEGVYNITGVVLRNYVYGSRYYQYTIEASMDDQTYIEIASKTNTNVATNAGDSYAVTATARYLKVTMNYNSTSANVYITDFKVYGTSVGHVITGSAGVGGTISPSGDIAVTSGADQTFNIIPDVGYQIADVMVDGNTSLGPVSSYTFTNVTANHTISATFSAMTNIALNKPATAQSAFSSATLAGKAVDSDGTNSSYWGASPSPQWLKVDLEGVYNITGVVLRNYVYGSRYYQYTIEASMDDQTYTEIASKANTNVATNAGDSYGVTTTARYLKVTMTYNSTSASVYITDFRVYGTSVGHVITGSAGVGGTISPSGDIAITSGADQTFNITPDVGYQIADVLLDGTTSLGPVSSYTFTNVTANHTISATFSAMTNIALGKPATSQSALSSNTLASKAVDVDGTNSSYWGASPSPQWLKVDLEGVYNITGVVLRNYVYGSRYYQYTIEASIDDQTYIEIASKANTNVATSGGDGYGVTTTARYLRVTMIYNSTSQNVYITDFRVYGTIQGGGKGDDTSVTPLIKQELTQEPLINEYNLNVYPNPFRDRISVRIDSPGDEMFDISIIGLNGGTIYLKTEIPANIENTLDLVLSRGMYILIVSNKEKRMIQRIVKY